MISEKKIGKVISVDSFRVYIKLDEDLKSLYKSGYEDIYEVARINSYVIIPNGADRIVAIVTRVRAIDETELNSDKAAIFLTQSARYLVATMIGTIDNNGSYIQGVYNYPVLDNPVWYIIKEDLDKIFDQKDSVDVDYTEDYFLPIGTSPAFADYKIKINPDKFFGKHAAILGNTGSGKSCTVASIIQSLFNYDYRGQGLKSAHFIIFDTNGEYKKAFMGFKKKSGEEVEYAKKKEVNTFYIDQSGMKVPYWFMNFDDLDYLFKPTANTQVPILKRALSIAKDNQLVDGTGLIPRQFIFYLAETLTECQSPDYKIRNRIFKELHPFCTEFNKIVTTYDTSGFKSVLKKLYSEKKNFKEGAKYIDGFLNPTIFNEISNELAAELSKYNSYASEKVVNEERNIDLPIWFEFKKLVTQFLDNAIDELESSNNRIREFISTLRLRLQSFSNDERIANPLMLTSDKSIEKALAKFLAFILGDFCKIYKDSDSDLFSTYYKNQHDKTGLDKVEVKMPNQVTIIDMSLLPFEVLETITGLVGRVILEFVSRFENDDRGKLPTVIVLEEAQNYIPEKDNGERVSISKKVFERIAREGRKYGISLLVSSQRPSELSKTVLSQCNSFVIHRLQNPEDQKYVRQLVSSANEDILQQLPILPQQHAVIMGDAVRTPVQVKINNANPKPNSDNPEFIKNWLEDKGNDFPDYKGISEAWEKGKKYEKGINEIKQEDGQDEVPISDVQPPPVSSDKADDNLPF